MSRLPTLRVTSSQLHNVTVRAMWEEWGWDEWELGVGGSSPLALCAAPPGSATYAMALLTSCRGSVARRAQLCIGKGASVLHALLCAAVRPPPPPPRVGHGVTWR